MEAVAKNTIARDAKKLLNGNTAITAVSKMSAEEVRKEAEFIRKEQIQSREKNRARREEKAEKIEKVLGTRYIYQPSGRHPMSTSSTTATKEHIEYYTKPNTCFFQHIYLDNNRTCNKCPWVEHCLAECKKLKK